MTPPAAGIAETVGRIYAMAAEEAVSARSGDGPEIQAITDAMVRLLIGTPLRSDGQLTIKSLAEEAGLKRNKLTHKHTGLKDLFYALVQMQDSRPKVLDGLKQQNDQLKEKLADLRQEHNQLVTDVKQLVRVIHVLEVENHQLRKSADQGGGGGGGAAPAPPPPPGGGGGPPPGAR
ncbi:hypothetical protein ACIQGT_26840, partial [Streptomyces sp. NPDC093108]|uniref:hypothetical protein n=1 Tax=Streptomyces sp. NPDC093108 TaxID=3366030 RepID=UPI0037F110C5